MLCLLLSLLLTGPALGAESSWLVSVRQTAATASPGGVLDVAVRDRRLFTRERLGSAQRPSLFVRNSPEAEPLVVLEESRLGPEESLAWWQPSQDGQLLAYGVAKPRTGQVELRLREVDSAADLPDRMSRVPRGPVAWLPDRTALYYVRLAASSAQPPGLWLHVLGTDASRDTLALSSAALSGPFDLQLSEDGKILVLLAGATLLIQDRSRPGSGWLALPEASGARQILLAGQNLYVLCGGRLLRFDLRRPRTPRLSSSGLEGPLQVQALGVLRRGLASLAEEDGLSRLQWRDHKGRPIREIPTPGPGLVSGLAADPGRDELFFIWQSLLHPPELCRFDSRTSSFTVLEPVSGPEPENFKLRQTQDLILVSPRLLKRDGDNPTILAPLPEGGQAYSPLLITWIGLGGLWAAPRCQGPAVAASARAWLVDQEYTRPARLAAIDPPGPETQLPLSLATERDTRLLTTLLRGMGLEPAEPAKKKPLPDKAPAAPAVGPKPTGR